MGRFLKLAIFAVAIVEAKKSKKNKEKSTTTDSNRLGEIQLPNGVALTFSDSKAAPQLLKWAHALTQSEGTVSHGVAVSRERFVVEQVSLGKRF
jgi:hypothetical protein